MRKKPKPAGVDFDVVGLDHRVKPGGQKILAGVVEERPLNCELQREPQNLYDKNAIKVYVEDERIEPYFKRARVHIGYIRRATAAVLASGFDAQRLVVKRCRLVYVNPDHGWGRVNVAFLKKPASKGKTRT